MIIPKTDFKGIPVSILKLCDLKAFIKSSIFLKEKKVMYGFSLHSIYNIPRVPEIVELGKNADIIVIDGRPFSWLLKLYKIPIKDVISIPELVLFTLDIANENSFSVMLLGATKEINLKAVRRIKKDYPMIRNVTGHHGYFKYPTDFNEICETINQAKPDILLIGMPSPVKELIAFQQLNNLDAKIIIPCGGMIDVLAGKTKITPRFLKRLGLASFYRVIQEPKRLLWDRLKFYCFVFFNLLPTLMYHSVIIRNTHFSLIDHYKKK